MSKPEYAVRVTDVASGLVEKCAEFKTAAENMTAARKRLRDRLRAMGRSLLMENVKVETYRVTADA